MLFSFTSFLLVLVGFHRQRSTLHLGVHHEAFNSKTGSSYFKQRTLNVSTTTVTVSPAGAMATVTEVILI